MNRSGTPTTPNETRKRKMVMLSLSDEAIAKADKLAKARATKSGEKENRSATVEELILRARLPGER